MLHVEHRQQISANNLALVHEAEKQALQVRNVCYVILFCVGDCCM